MGLIISRYFSEHAGELPELQHLMLSNLADRADPHATAGTAGGGDLDPGARVPYIKISCSVLPPLITVL